MSLIDSILEVRSCVADIHDVTSVSHLRTRPRTAVPEYLADLSLAMIKRAIIDLDDSRWRDDAVDWLENDDEDNPLSFDNCCTILDLNAAGIRRQLATR